MDQYSCEADDDGIDYLLTTQDTIPQHLWEREGARIGYLVRQQEGRYAVCLRDDFVEGRTEVGTDYRVPWQDWQDDLGTPTFRAVCERRSVKPKARFVHLHVHSEFSLLDGLSKVSEIVSVTTADGQPAVAVTDHGNCSAHPLLQHEAEKAGIKPIFGMEANFVPDRKRRPVKVILPDGKESSDAREVANEYMHLTLWAMDDAGLRNLWAMSTESYVDGFYGRPRLDWDTLSRLNEGVMCGTGCLRGPIARPLAADDIDQAVMNMARLQDIFGDRLYAEIHVNSMEQQRLVNTMVLDLADAMQVEPIAVVDSHYPTKAHQPIHALWLRSQTDKTMADESTLFSDDPGDYYLMGAEEVGKALHYLEPDVAQRCMDNTVTVAERCTARLVGETDPPIYSKPSAEHPDPVKRDEERVREMCEANWSSKIVGKDYSEEEARERYEREMALYASKRFCGYLLVVADFVGYAKQHGARVGPSRGSGGGSLVGYLLDIHGLDPIDFDLMFERFLTTGRKGLPDYDIDFPTSWRTPITDYVIHRWGADKVARIGTTIRLQTKGAIDTAVRVLSPVLPYEIAYTDVTILKKLVDAADAPLAGKHLSWDDFCAQFEDAVAPLIDKYPEVFDAIEQVVGRVKTFGKHPAGIVISSDKPLTDLPMRVGDDGNLITQFDMEAIELLGYCKFDFLTLRTLDTIQETLDLIEQRYGSAPSPYDWRDEYLDPQVWQEVAAGRTLGLFQVETKEGTRLIKRLKPHSIAELADVMTLVRPGPKRSGLTETYLRRRDGLEPVSFPDERMAEVLASTQGAMIYQEQVMAATMRLAGYDENEADAVRKILGKKLVEKVAEAGREFVSRAAEHGMNQADAQALWDQMAEFSKYAFGKAHAYGYAVLGWWTAWLKYHYPVEFLSAAMSTVDEDRLPEFINEARRMGYRVLPPDINDSELFFTPYQTDIRYGIANIKGIGESTADAIVKGKPYADYQDFVARMVTPPGSPVNRGHLNALLMAGAFDSVLPNRRAAEVQLAREASGEAKRCIFRDDAISPLPCRFDWANEPNAPYVLKGRGKNKVKVPKDPPKRCTVSCRQYRPPDPVADTDVEPYSPDEIRQAEVEMLGTWLTGSPFDAIPPDVLERECSVADEVEDGPNGVYVVAAVVEKAPRERRNPDGDAYAFLTLQTPQGSLEAVCFADSWQVLRHELKRDNLVVAMVNKTERGCQMLDAHKVT